MTTISIILLVLIVLLVAILVVLAIGQRNNGLMHRRELEERDGELAALRTRLSDSERELTEERIRHVRTTSERDALSQSIEDMRRDREQSDKQLKSEFRNLAQEILTEHQNNLRQTNRDSIDLLLKPFKDNITEFRERVERIYAHENEQRGALKNELDNLIKLNQQMTSSAANLTDALKGNSKVQGDWGEAYLETILESTGLVRGVHYHVQQNLKDESGANLRPDVVLSLPEERRIIIDSKVSLTAYVRFTEAESEAERRQAMAEHVQSVRKHVQELASKGYERLVASPDFVVMFIPTEPAFLEALKADSDIWADAYARKVIISSPTNLFALLKMVADMWRRDAQNKNQAEIIEKATKLYEQLVVFSEQLEGVGSALDTAKSRYDEAYKRLHTGNNNIVRLGERLKKLGLPTKKQQSARSLAAADVASEDEE
ncbi:MAG: DNA recombination protein RmuC [Alistipes sp.]|nr:DNA recombination protein RmuC [Alistipes sp.]